MQDFEFTVEDHKLYIAADTQRKAAPARPRSASLSKCLKKGSSMEDPPCSVWRLRSSISSCTRSSIRNRLRSW